MREDIAEGSSSDLLSGARCNTRVIRTRVFGYTSETRFVLTVVAVCSPVVAPTSPYLGASGKAPVVLQFGRGRFVTHHRFHPHSDPRS